MIFYETQWSSVILQCEIANPSLFVSLKRLGKQDPYCLGVNLVSEGIKHNDLCFWMHYWNPRPFFFNAWILMHFNFKWTFFSGEWNWCFSHKTLPHVSQSTSCAHNHVHTQKLSTYVIAFAVAFSDINWGVREIFCPKLQLQQFLHTIKVLKVPKHLNEGGRFGTLRREILCI